MNLFGIKISLPGEATMQRSKKGMQDIASYQRTAYQDMYANPQTPYDKAQYGQLQASALRGTQTAAQQLQRNLMQRGLGQSSLASNALSGLWSQYGQQLTNARLHQMGLYDQRRLAALQGLGGVSGIYGNLGQMGAQEYGNTISGLGQLASLYASGGMSAAAPRPADPVATGTSASYGMALPSYGYAMPTYAQALNPLASSYGYAPMSNSQLYNYVYGG